MCVWVCFRIFAGQCMFQSILEIMEPFETSWEVKLESWSWSRDLGSEIRRIEFKNELIYKINDLFLVVHGGWCNDDIRTVENRWWRCLIKNLFSEKNNDIFMNNYIFYLEDVKTLKNYIFYGEYDKWKIKKREICFVFDHKI